MVGKVKTLCPSYLCTWALDRNQVVSPCCPCVNFRKGTWDQAIVLPSKQCLEGAGLGILGFVPLATLQLSGCHRCCWAGVCLRPAPSRSCCSPLPGPADGSSPTEPHLMQAIKCWSTAFCPVCPLQHECSLCLITFFCEMVLFLKGILQTKISITFMLRKKMGKIQLSLQN